MLKREVVYGETIIANVLMLQNKLGGWRVSKIRSPCRKAILSLIAKCICQELWCNRNGGRFENRVTPAIQ